MSEQSDVLATLDTYANAYCAKDVGGLIALFDPGYDVSVMAPAPTNCAAAKQRSNCQTRGNR